MKEKSKTEAKDEKYIASLAEKYTEGLPTDVDTDEITGRLIYSSPLSEVGLREKDLKKDSEENPFYNVDLDDLINNMRYDDNY
jgi:hypothetical protein